MADHNNIRSPRDRMDLEERLQRERLEAELTVLREAYDDLRGDLDAIFTRIGRGDQVDLQFPDGEIVTITRARPRKSQEG